MSTPAQTDRRDTVVIIPMYNERENAAAIIDAVLELPHQFDILVIDDSSPDGTAAIVKEKIAETPAGSTSSNAPASSGSARPTSPASSGRSARATTTSARWTPTSRTIPPT